MKIRSTIFVVLPLVILLFLTTGTLGQVNPKWGPWEKVDCYSGISASIVNMGPSKAAGGYLWGIRFRNDYDAPVQFSYKMAVGEDPIGEFGFDVTTKLKPGEIWTDGADKFTAKLYKSPSNSYAVKIKGVCFKDAYCGKECYAGCDITPKKPNAPACGATRSSPQSDQTEPSDESGNNNSSSSGGETDDVVGEFESGGVVLKIEKVNGGLNVSAFGEPSIFWRHLLGNTYTFDGDLKPAWAGADFYLEFKDKDTVEGWSVRKGSAVPTSSRTAYKRKRVSQAQKSENNCPVSGKWARENRGGTYLLKIVCKGDDVLITFEGSGDNASITGKTVLAKKKSSANMRYPGRPEWEGTWPYQEDQSGQSCTITEPVSGILLVIFGDKGVNYSWRVDFQKVP